MAIGRLGAGAMGALAGIMGGAPLVRTFIWPDYSPLDIGGGMSGLVALGGLLLVLGMAGRSLGGGKGENAWGGELARQLKDMFLPGLKNTVNRMIHGVPLLGENFKDILDLTREPWVFRQNKPMIMALLQYGHRLNVIHATQGYLRRVEKRLTKLSKKIGHHSDPAKLRRDIYDTKVSQKEDGKEYGWCRADKRIVEIANEVAQVMQKAREDKDKGITKNAAGYASRVQQLTTELQSIRSEAGSSWERFYGEDGTGGMVSRLGRHHEVRAHLWNLTDVGNPSGRHRHTYLLAKGRNGELTGQEIARDGMSIEAVHKGTVARKVVHNPRLEAGFPSEAYEVLGHIMSDASFYIEDFAQGTYSGNGSRTVEMYTAALQKLGSAVQDNDDLVEGTGGTIPFDRRALADPGIDQYPGRVRFDDRNPANIRALPRMTIYGIEAYIRELAKVTASESANIAHAFEEQYLQGMSEKARTANENTKSPREDQRDAA